MISSFVCICVLVRDIKNVDICAARASAINFSSSMKEADASPSKKLQGESRPTLQDTCGPNKVQTQPTSSGNRIDFLGFFRYTPTLRPVPSDLVLSGTHPAEAKIEQNAAPKAETETKVEDPKLKPVSVPEPEKEEPRVQPPPEKKEDRRKSSMMLQKRKRSFDSVPKGSTGAKRTEKEPSPPRQNPVVKICDAVQELNSKLTLAAALVEDSKRLVSALEIARPEEKREDPQPTSKMESSSPTSLLLLIKQILRPPVTEVSIQRDLDLAQTQDRGPQETREERYVFLMGTATISDYRKPMVRRDQVQTHLLS